MKPTLSMLVLFAALAGPLAAPAQEPAATEDAVSAWFVELRGLPVADGGSPADLAAGKKAFRAAAEKAGVQMKERYSYDTLFNGLSVEVGAGGLATLTRLAEVKNVYPVIELSVPDPEDGSEPDLATALAMTQADVAQNTLGLSGAGIRVAIMDTGLDYDHPDLGGCFGPGCRVEVGFDFVGDAFDSGTNPVPVPDPFPDDCNGHGTHVAGIVGANGNVKGVAPGVTYGAYRVFGCDGTTSADIMVAAMERLLADGADVLNMSIGSAFQWPQYPTAQASDRLVNKGVVVVASIGNSGANGLYASSAPGVGAKVIGVANFQNTHINLPVFTISGDNLAVGYSQATAALSAPLSGSYPMARTGTAASVNDACNAVAPPPGSLTGKVALIRRGTCGFHEKTVNAQNAGAVGVVIYNNVAGLQNITVAGPVAIDIPVVSITAADGVTINNRLAAGPVTMTWTAQTLSTPNALANRISASSSYGVGPDLSLKPDIGAPGGSIRSTYPLELGGYANISGTSMSSPHVAGSVALLLEARPNTPSNAVRTILQNYAEPRLWSLNPGLGFLDHTHRQGAGMLQIADAITGTVKVEPGKLSLGESEGGPATRTLTVSNDGPSGVTFDLLHEPALATGPNTFTPSFPAAFAATATWSAPTLTVPAGGTATVDVTVSPNAGLADRSLYGGYLVLAPQGGGREVRVPYSGFKGDYQSILVLAPTTANLPCLATQAATATCKPGGATYTLQGADIPFFLFHLDHQVRELRLEIYDADTGKAWHRAFSTEYQSRNSGANTFFAVSWDGQTASGNKTYTLPDGRYVAKLTVRKALGDSANPAHSESWTSPVITLDRP